MSRIAVFPSLLAADFTRLGEEVACVEQAGADGLHLDVMDGHFTPNLTWGPAVIAALRPLTKLFFDAHLMIEQPERSVDAYLAAGAQRVTVHQEATVHLHRLLASIRSQGVQAGVAINPATPLAAIEPILGEVDAVLLMTVNPGFGGQAFLPFVLPKLRALRALVGPDLPIQVDGGINAETAPQVISAGATELVAGAAFFGQRDRAAALRSLRPQ